MINASDGPDPAPRQPGLTDVQQRRLDAHNYDQIAVAVDEGSPLTEAQTATWRALAARLGRPDPVG